MYKLDNLTATKIIKKIRYLEQQNWLHLSDLTLIPSLKARAFPFGKAVINKVKSSDDIIYEVFRSEKRSGWFHFWDTIFDVIPSTTTKLLNNKVMYLLASEKSGKIIEVENGTITNITEVPDWISDKKMNFNKIVIDNYIYKKFKKIS